MSTSTVSKYVPVMHTINTAPSFVYGTLEVGKVSTGALKVYHVTPLWPIDHASLSAFARKDGMNDKAVEGISRCCEGHLKGNSLSVYVLRSEHNQIAGLITWCPKKDGELKLGFYIGKEFRKQELATTAWRWTVEHFLPLMVSRGVKVGDTPLEEARLSISGLPEFLAAKAGNAGFTVKEVDAKRVQTIVVKELFKKPQLPATNPFAATSTPVIADNTGSAANLVAPVKQDDDAKSDSEGSATASSPAPVTIAGGAPVANRWWTTKAIFG